MPHCCTSYAASCVVVHAVVVWQFAATFRGLVGSVMVTVTVPGLVVTTPTVKLVRRGGGPPVLTIGVHRGCEACGLDGDQRAHTRGCGGRQGQRLHLRDAQHPDGD